MGAARACAGGPSTATPDEVDSMRETLRPTVDRTRLEHNRNERLWLWPPRAKDGAVWRAEPTDDAARRLAGLP